MIKCLGEPLYSLYWIFFFYFSYGILQLQIFCCCFLLKFSFCSSIVLLNSLSIFMILILSSLFGNSYTSMSLGSVSGDLLCSFGPFLLLLMFLVTLCLHPHIWKNHHHSHSLWNGFIQSKTFAISLWGPLKPFLWVCLLAFVCVDSLERFAGFFFPEFIISCSLWCLSAISLSSSTPPRSFRFSVVSRHLDYASFHPMFGDR